MPNGKKWAILLIEETDKEPLPDLASCFDCDWSGKVSECDTEEEEGDWESGYYQVEICPKCGGGIEYDMSDIRISEWEAWESHNKEDHQHA